MSLSRYYKSTPSFHPEELVKQEDKATPGWSPDPRKDQRPFQTQPMPPPVKAQTSIAGNDSVIRQHSPRESFETGHPSPVNATPPDSTKDNVTVPPAPESVDLSNYLHRADAEKQASKAYQRGLKAGLDKAEEDYGRAAKALLFACQQLDTLRATIIGNSSEELLEFSLAIADRILRLSVREQDHTIVATIEEALRRAVRSDEFTILLHPEDYDTLIAKSAEIVAGLSGLNNIVVRKDQGVERGGALIESDNCTVDATIASQFEMIREEVKNKTP
jgi:flagellar assembly protein FliH